MCSFRFVFWSFFKQEKISWNTFIIVSLKKSIFILAVSYIIELDGLIGTQLAKHLIIIYLYWGRCMTSLATILMEFYDTFQKIWNIMIRRYFLKVCSILEMASFLPAAVCSLSFKQEVVIFGCVSHSNVVLGYLDFHCLGFLIFCGYYFSLLSSWDLMRLEVRLTLEKIDKEDDFILAL